MDSGCRQATLASLLRRVAMAGMSVRRARGRIKIETIMSPRPGPGACRRRHFAEALQRGGLRFPRRCPFVSTDGGEDHKDPGPQHVGALESGMNSIESSVRPEIDQAIH